MDAIENAAFISVGRACGFFGLGVFCLMFGLSFEPVLAARSGAILCLFFALILCAYAIRARTRPYRRTELWLILAKDCRPPAGIAQRVIGETLRETYFWFARQAVLISILLWTVVIFLRFLEQLSG